MDLLPEQSLACLDHRLGHPVWMPWLPSSRPEIVRNGRGDRSVLLQTPPERLDEDQKLRHKLSDFGQEEPRRPARSINQVHRLMVLEDEEHLPVMEI
ncbi:hypothetical protein N7471_010551 [Penicillium samsonianum]|uniref:uncharacterized protein n=1 Tax=Penicillium samsonianum TaxID=1882272 RepID=UPI002549210D|nr:uncharacterized protein N7471_010551 [Penicillium samsonianum]KAJ6126058.1 hypothetical protein N7471_010551 [Penicillium samsonianum]